MITNTLLGRKQKPEHVLKRTFAIREAYKRNPRQASDRKKILMSRIIKNENGCWVWTGARFKKPHGDYGQIRVGRRGNNKLERAHRISYEIFKGEIPNGLEIDHLCRNTLCINPTHLEAVTHTVNMQRRYDITGTYSS